MKRLLLALGLIASSLVPAFGQSTKAQLNTEVSTNFPDNTTGAITPAILRSTTNDIIASFQQAPVVNAQVGTTYVIVVGDYGKLVTFSNGSPVAVTLPQATTTFATFNVMVKNVGSGTVTITPTTSTINGASTLVLLTGQGATIVSDGANYQALSSSPGFANPTATIGLSAVNGTATTGMRSDAAPSLSQAITPTWTGTHTFAPTAGGITPAITLTQSLTGGNGSSAVIGNTWVVTNNGFNGGALPANDAYQFDYLLNSGSIQGGQHALEIFLTLQQATSASNALKQYAAIAATFTGQSADGGTGGTPKGAGYGSTFQCVLLNGATNYAECTASESSVSVQTGASANYVAGWTIVQRNDHAVQGLTFDCGYCLSNQGGAIGWNDLFLMGPMNGVYPGKANGNIFRTIGGTSANGFDISTTTITGNAWSSPAATLSGTGIWNAVFRPQAGSFAAGIAQIYTTSGGGSNGLTLTMSSSGGTNDGGFFSAAGTFLFVNPAGTNNVGIVTGGGALSVGTTATIATFNGTTASTTPATGSIINAGGFGNAGEFWNGGGININTAAKTLSLKRGANGAVGTFVCTSGGSITVTNSFVAVTDTIIISLNTAGGTISNAPALNAITAATSFVAKCATSDTSTYNYAIIKNAA